VTNPVADGWSSYRDLVLSPDASEVQVQVVQDAFYAGAGEALILLGMGISESSLAAEYQAHQDAVEKRGLL